MKITTIRLLTSFWTLKSEYSKISRDKIEMLIIAPWIPWLNTERWADWWASQNCNLASQPSGRGVKPKACSIYPYGSANIIISFKCIFALSISTHHCLHITPTHSSLLHYLNRSVQNLTNKQKTTSVPYLYTVQKSPIMMYTTIQSKSSDQTLIYLASCSNLADSAFSLKLNQLISTLLRVPPEINIEMKTQSRHKTKSESKTQTLTLTTSAHSSFSQINSESS